MFKKMGGSTGLVVTGGDSWSEGRGFESQLSNYTGWTFCTYTMFVGKDENKRKEAGDGPLFFQKCDVKFVHYLEQEIFVYSSQSNLKKSA